MFKHIINKVIVTTSQNRIVIKTSCNEQADYPVTKLWRSSNSKELWVSVIQKTKWAFNIRRYSAGSEMCAFASALK